MNVVKVFLISFLFIWGSYAYGQECFKDCPERLSLMRDSILRSLKRNYVLKEKQDSSFSLAFNECKKIEAALKKCSFPKTYLKTIDGDSICIDQFKGKPVFIHFWFTSCSPCIAEIPTINRLETEFKNSATFLSINTDDLNTLKKFLARKIFNTQHVIISKETAAENFCIIGGYPTNIILDKNGKVSDIWSGGFEDPNDQEEFYERVSNGLKSILKIKK